MHDPAAKLPPDLVRIDEMIRRALCDRKVRSRLARALLQLSDSELLRQGPNASSGDADSARENDIR